VSSPSGVCAIFLVVLYYIVLVIHTFIRHKDRQDSRKINVKTDRQDKTKLEIWGRAQREAARGVR